MTIAVTPATPVIDLSPPPISCLSAALFLDFDGTLAPIAPRPDAVRTDPGLPDLLRRLRDRLEGRLAVVSGRPLDYLEALLPIEGMAASGSHGIELRCPDGTIDRPSPDPALAMAKAELIRFTRRVPGTLVEDKPYGVGLHYRGAPEAKAASMALAERLADETGLVVQHGNMVAELRMAGRDKGDALRALMQAQPFPRSIPVFVGDDITDEHGFRAASELGGYGVLVGPLRATGARHRLDDVDDVLGWLAALAAPEAR